MKSAVVSVPGRITLQLTVMICGYLGRDVRIQWGRLTARVISRTPARWC